MSCRPSIKCLEKWLQHMKSGFNTFNIYRQGIRTQLKGGTIIIENKNFTYQDIDSLPYGFSLEAAKMVKVVDGVAVQGHHAYAPNIHACMHNKV